MEANFYHGVIVNECFLVSSQIYRPVLLLFRPVHLFIDINSSFFGLNRNTTLTLIHNDHLLMNNSTQKDALSKASLSHNYEKSGQFTWNWSPSIFSSVLYLNGIKSDGSFPIKSCAICNGIKSNWSSFSDKKNASTI